MPEDRRLRSVADDLWGERRPAAKADKSAKAAPMSFPPFEQLWKTVDETVPWTEVLAHATPTDGVTPPDMWALYRRYAQQVLAGDASAYLAVLKAIDPLKDLTPWADKFDVACQSADAIKVEFTAYEKLAASQGRAYLAGMSLRIARDLFALLPLMQVQVNAVCDGRTLLTVGFERTELQKVRFAFIDPVDFVVQCGGVFTDTAE